MINYWDEPEEDHDKGMKAYGADIVKPASRDYWEKLRKAIKDDDSCGEPICCTADVAIEMLEAHDRGEL